MNCARPIWVDALSISQSDIQEKNQQVRMIDRIFSQARQVIAWLGKHEDHSDAVFDAISEALKVPEVRERFSKRTRSRKEHSETFDMIARNVAIGDDPHFMIFKRAYFTRTWIIQEVALAQHIVIRCGGSEVSWDDFDFWCQCLGSQSKDSYWYQRSPADFHRLSAARAEYHRGPRLATRTRVNSIATLVSSSRWSDCTIALDRVYAVRALEHLEFWHEPIPVDYNCKYADFFFWMCAQRLITYDVYCHVPRLGCGPVSEFQRIYEDPLWVPRNNMCALWSGLRLDHSHALSMLHLTRTKLRTVAASTAITSKSLKSRHDFDTPNSRTSNMLCCMREWWGLVAQSLFWVIHHSQCSDSLGQDGFIKRWALKPRWRCDFEGVIEHIDRLMVGLAHTNTSADTNIQASLQSLEDPPMPRWWGEHEEARLVRDRLEAERVERSSDPEGWGCYGF